jgi:hypothetical protein
MSGGYVQVLHPSFQGSLAARRQLAFGGARDSCLMSPGRAGRPSLPLLQPDAKALLLRDNLDFLLAGQPSQAKAQKLVRPIDLLLQLGSVCGPSLERACQTFPAVSPTWLLMSMVRRQAPWIGLCPSHECKTADGVSGQLEASYIGDNPFNGRAKK